MKQYILFFTLFFLKVIGYKSQNKPYFPNLTKVLIDSSNKAYFYFEKKASHLINKPCFLLSSKNEFYCKKEEELAAWVLVAKVKSDISKDSLTILYSEGMSVDPMFTVLSKNKKTLRRFWCTEFFINTSGTIYTSGHTNNMYNRKRKFQLEGDTIKEIIQPFSYVGVKGKLLKSIKLYKEKVGTELVAQLTKNHEVEILLGDSSVEDFGNDLFFLVKTEFGLVGWLRLDNDEINGGILNELYYAGD